MTEISKETLSLEEGNLKVELEWIGEGQDGDYDLTDPDDCPLLRFSLHRRGDDGEWEYVENSSYCTQLDARLDDEVKGLAMKTILTEAGGLTNVKRTCERLSWLDEQAVRNMAAPTP